MMRIAFAPGAWRAWQKLPTNIQTRLEEKLTQYARDPLRYATKLTDSKIGQYRFRIGNYRIVLDLREDELMILAVAHRKDIYG